METNDYNENNREQTEVIMPEVPVEAVDAQEDEEQNEPRVHGKLYNFFYNIRFPLLASGCTAFIMIVVYYCYHLIPFGDITILRMDLYHQYGPLFAEFYDRLTTLGSFFYSWNTGGGSSFIGNFANYVSSPFSYLILLFGHKNMTEAIATIILLKSATASFTFSHYLSRTYKHNTPATAAFGVLYSGCGFFIAYYWNVMWLDAFYLLPLMVMGIEKLINERKMKLFYVSLVIAFLTNYYMAYMLCVFAVLYFIAYYFSRYIFTDTYLGRLAKPERGFASRIRQIIFGLRNSRLFDSGVRFTLTAVGAALSCAFLLIPVYYILKTCSATSDAFPEQFKTYFSVFDFLANHLNFLEPTIRSSGEDVLPNVFCGIITVMLVPLYLFCKKIDMREKVAYISLLGIMFASCYTNYLNFFWHGFHFPNDLPYRFSFIYSFLLLVIAFNAFRHLKEFTGRQILGTGVGVIFFAILVQEIGSKNFSEMSMWVTVAFVGIYVLILYVINNPRYPHIAVSVLLLCAVCAEYLVSNTDNYSMDQSKTSYAGDYEEFRGIKDILDSREGTEHYRMELTSLRARMDPSWYNYNGVSVFSSMAYEKSSNMQYHLGMFSNYINSYTYNAQTPVYNAMFALKYIVDNNNTLSNNELYAYTAENGKFTAYTNNYYLPIAYRVNLDTEYWNHDTTNPFEVQESYWQLATGVANVFDDLEVTDTLYDNIDSFSASAFTSGDYYYYKKTDGIKGNVTNTYTVNKSQNVYVYLKSSNSSIDNITVDLNGEYYKSQTIDTKPYILDLGLLEAGDTFTVSIPIKDTENTGVFHLHAVGLDMDGFISGYNTLAADSLNVTEFKDTKIVGDINASADGLLYTSINYDEGWSVYIDGVKVNKSDYKAIGGALLAVPITAGQHTVEMKYTAMGFKAGALISLMTLCIIVLVMLLIKAKVFSFTPKLRSEQLAEEELEAERLRLAVENGEGFRLNPDAQYYYESDEQQYEADDGEQDNETYASDSDESEDR